jgi:hypothetical protein
MGERRFAGRVLMGKRERRRPLEKRRRRGEYNIKIYLCEGGLGAWTGSIWLSIMTGEWLLLMR